MVAALTRSLPGFCCGRGWRRTRLAITPLGVEKLIADVRSQKVVRLINIWLQTMSGRKSYLPF